MAPRLRTWAALAGTCALTVWAVMYTRSGGTDRAQDAGRRLAAPVAPGARAQAPTPVDAGGSGRATASAGASSPLWTQTVAANSWGSPRYGFATGLGDAGQLRLFNGFTLLGSSSPSIYNTQSVWNTQDPTQATWGSDIMGWAWDGLAMHAFVAVGKVQVLLCGLSGDNPVSATDHTLWVNDDNWGGQYDYEFPTPDDSGRYGHTAVTVTAPGGGPTAALMIGGAPVAGIAGIDKAEVWYSTTPDKSASWRLITPATAAEAATAAAEEPSAAATSAAVAAGAAAAGAGAAAATMPWAGRHGHATVVLDDGVTILMFGGSSTNTQGTAVLNDVWACADGYGKAWTRLGPDGGSTGTEGGVAGGAPVAPWSPRVWHMAATHEGFVYMAGGFPAPVTDASAYTDSLSDVWRWRPMPSAAAAGTAAAATATASLTGRWERAAQQAEWAVHVVDMVYGRAAGALVSYKGKLSVIGGAAVPWQQNPPGGAKLDTSAFYSDTWTAAPQLACAQDGVLCSGAGTCTSPGSGVSALGKPWKCVCSSANVGGPLCDACAATHYGDGCAGVCPGVVTTGSTSSPCHGHGSCDGAGTTGGTGACKCDAHWDAGGDGTAQSACSQCLPNWAGDAACSTCAANYYGPSCAACQPCTGHGACDGAGSAAAAGTGKCVCEAGWAVPPPAVDPVAAAAGDCSVCADGYVYVNATSGNADAEASAAASCVACPRAPASEPDAAAAADAAPPDEWADDAAALQAADAAADTASSLGAICNGHGACSYSEPKSAAVCACTGGWTGTACTTAPHTTPSGSGSGSGKGSGSGSGKGSGSGTPPHTHHDDPPSGSSSRSGGSSSGGTTPGASSATSSSSGSGGGSGTEDDVVAVLGTLLVVGIVAAFAISHRMRKAAKAAAKDQAQGNVSLLPMGGGGGGGGGGNGAYDDPLTMMYAPPTDLQGDDSDEAWARRRTVLVSELTDMHQLGRGSFGVVHRASWRGTQVAVKVPLDQSSLGDIVGEARLLERVSNHPNVVSLVGVALSPWKALVLYYYPRGSLEELVYAPRGGGDGSSASQASGSLPPVYAAGAGAGASRANSAGGSGSGSVGSAGGGGCVRATLPWIEAVRMAAEAAAGMTHLASQGVTHRDLAARNLLVDTDWRVAVADFGMARVKDAARSSSEGTTLTLQGPIKWEAPECLRVYSAPAGPAAGAGLKRYGEETDVYSFGCVLFEIAAGVAPWAGLTNQQAGTRVVGGQRPALPGTATPNTAEGAVAPSAPPKGGFSAGGGPTPVFAVPRPASAKPVFASTPPGMSAGAPAGGGGGDPVWIALMHDCWAEEPAARPRFHAVLRRLQAHLDTLRRDVETAAETAKPLGARAIAEVWGR